MPSCATRARQARQPTPAATTGPVFAIKTGSLFSIGISETRQADDRAFWLKIRDILQGILTQDYLDHQLSKLRESTEQPFHAPTSQVVEVTAKRFRFSHAERESVLEHLIRGHNGQSELTRYGLAQAITRASHNLPDYERSTEFECIGGQIIDLSANQWQAIAEARPM